MTEADVEIILQRAREAFPDAASRIISDNGPQFISKDFKEFIRISGMTQSIVMNNDLPIIEEMITIPLAGETEVRQRRTRDSRLGVTDYRMGGRSQIARPAHFLEMVIQSSLMPKRTSLPKARHSLNRKCNLSNSR